MIEIDDDETRLRISSIIMYSIAPLIKQNNNSSFGCSLLCVSGGMSCTVKRQLNSHFRFYTM